MDNPKIIKQFISNLDKNGFDSSLLKNDLFDFNQKFVLYNAIRSCANLEILANPDIDAYEMEDILDEQRALVGEMRKSHGIDPKKYNLSQLLELNDALAHGLDITHYKSHEYSAEHMYVAKTFQIEKLSGLDEITPGMDILNVVKLRDDSRKLKNLFTPDIHNSFKSNIILKVSTNEEVLKYFEQYDKNNDINKWRETGKIKTSVAFHYLENENPERVASLLNYEFKTNIKIDLDNCKQHNSYEVVNKNFEHDFEI